MPDQFQPDRVWMDGYIPASIRAIAIAIRPSTSAPARCSSAGAASSPEPSAAHLAAATGIHRPRSVTDSQPCPWRLRPATAVTST